MLSTGTANRKYAFDTPTPPDLTQVGGKAMSLILMTGEGLPVPSGFVLPVTFFRSWLEHIQQRPEWEQFLASSAENLKGRCDAVKAACTELQFTDEQKNEVLQAIDPLKTNTTKLILAVRSSSPEEDLESTSFAGGYETTLGVTVGTLEAAIRRSFASVFDERIVAYKGRHGLAIDQPRIAVIVQQQIDADSSGVAFSLNPMNNCFDEAVVNASFGLGETVVSGQVTPDTFVVDKVTRTIIERRLGHKDHALWLTESGGTVQRTVDDPSRPSLTDQQILEVTGLVNHVEEHFEKPMDIEWAYDDGQLYLLQARPITAYVPLPPEMVTRPGHPKRLYSDVLLTKQGIQEPLSIFGSDLIDRLADIVVRAQFGRDVRGVEDGLLFSVTGRMYMQVSNLAKVLGRKRIALVAGGADFASMKILKQIDYGEYLPSRTPKKLRLLLISLIKIGLQTGLPGLIGYIRPEATLRKYQQSMQDYGQKFQELEHKGGSFLELYEVSFKWMMDFLGSGRLLSILLPPIIARSRMSKLFRKEAVKDLMVHLEMALPGNPTSEMGKKMYELASFPEVKESPDGKAFARGLKEGSFSPEFRQAWDQYMEEFGFRCIREIDPATPRPYEQPAEFFHQLKSMTLADEHSENIFASAERKQKEAQDRLLTLATKRGKQKAFAKNLRIIRSMAGYREVPKYYMVMMTDLIRRRALVLADEWVEQSRLDNREQIFSLTLEDIERAGRDSRLDLRSAIERNTVFWKTVKDRKDWPQVVDSRGKIFRAPPDTTKPGILIGEPIAPGVVQGKIKVLDSPYEKPLEPGEILVTRATDPGWTPLFMNAAGVILEVGGALQHGAIIAREYGIPCVSGVDQAASTLRDGQVVEVDGSNGVVRIIQD